MKGKMNINPISGPSSKKEKLGDGTLSCTNAMIDKEQLKLPKDFSAVDSVDDGAGNRASTSGMIGNIQHLVLSLYNYICIDMNH